MANYRAVSSGVWSDLARWQDDSSGSYVASTVLPGAADVVYANNFTVTLDIDVVVSQLRTTSATNVNAGGLFDFGAGNSVTANITAGSSICVRNNTANTKTITGNISGGNASNGAGCQNSSTGFLIVNGNVIGGTGSNSFGCWNTSTGTIILNGNSVGGPGASLSTSGCNNQSVGTFIINGTATGGASVGVGALNGNGTLNLTKAIASSTAAGLNGSSSSGTTIVTESEDNLNGRQACDGFVLYSNIAQLSYTVTRQNGTQQLLTDNSTVNYPAEADVRNLVQYGPGNIYTGTLVAMFTPDEFLNAISVSPNPLAERMRNMSTVQTTGDQIAAAL